MDSAIHKQNFSSLSILSPPSPGKPQAVFGWSGLHGAASALAIARAIEQDSRLFMVVTADSHSAQQLEQEIRFFLDKTIPVLHFPDWETLPYDVFSPLPEIISQRLKTLARLPRTHQGVLITTVATLMQRLAPVNHILSQTLSLKVGDQLNLESIRQQLEQVGYQCVPQVQQHGEFAVRGAILDLFPMASDIPLRIELFDDEIESIRTFDPETQRSIDKIDAIELYPAREFPMDDQSIKRFRRAFRKAFPDLPSQNALYQDVSRGFLPGGIESYLPLFLEKTDTLFDYLPDQATLIVNHDESVIQAFFDEVEDRYSLRKGDLERPPLPPQTLYLSPREFTEKQRLYPRILLNIPGEKAQPFDFATQTLPDISLKPHKKSPAQALLDFVDQNPGPVLFTAEGPGRREVLMETLGKHDIKPKIVESWSEFMQDQPALGLTMAPLEEGLWTQEPALAVIPESRIFGEKVRQKRRRRESVRDMESLLADLSEMTIGAPVVHRDHGVGRYLGCSVWKWAGWKRNSSRWNTPIRTNCTSRFLRFI